MKVGLGAPTATIAKEAGVSNGSLFTYFETKADLFLINSSVKTGIYYGERGQSKQGSALVRDPTFQDRVAAETRALLATISQ